MEARVLETVWQEFHSRLFTFILKRVKNPSDAEDILQEVFLKIHRGLDGLKDTSSLGAWAYQITRNAIIDYYRSPSRRLETPLDTLTNRQLSQGIDDIDSNTGFASNPLKAYQEIANCLDPMLRRLPELYREAILQIEIGGLTQVAVANNLGLSVSAVKSRVQRGRKKLKKMLEECCILGLTRDNRLINYQVKRGTCSSCGDQSSKSSCQHQDK